MHIVKKIWKSDELIRFILIAGIVTCSYTAYSQQTDPVFTQYMNSMQTVNPAYAGMWEKVGFQVFTRRYYVGQDKAPLTNSLIMYTPLKNENNGLGLNVIDERFGYEKRLTIAFDYSYQVKLDWQTFLRLGLKTGFMNYDNLLTQYALYPDGINDPEFQSDVDINMLVNWGIGGLVYSRDYYIGLSIPSILENKFAANRNNYSTLAELRYAYLMAGILFGRQQQIRFKPTIMVKGSMGGKVQADIAANFMFFDKFWIGGMYRTNNKFAAIVQLAMFKNLRFGYAIEYNINWDISKYTVGTHEFRFVYEYDLYRRSYVKKQYF